MSNNRELSQLASLITVDDSDRSLGINTSVGIGTTNPTQKLQVYDGSVNVYKPTGEVNIQVESGDTSVAVFRAISPYRNWRFGIQGGANADFVIRDATDSRNRLGITSAGEVIIGSNTTPLVSTGTTSQLLQVTGGAYVSGSIGIGTTNPTNKLEVYGDIGVGTSYNYRLNLQNSNAYNIGFNSTSALIWGLQTSGGITTTLTITGWGDGNAYIDNRNNGDIYFRNTGGLGNNSNNLVFKSGGTLLIGSATSTGTANQTLQVHSGGAYFNGSVGIGTTNPTSRLHVVGDAYITGVITATNITGTATTATKLATPRSFEITGDVVASPIFFDGTGNVSLAATIQPNSVALGTDTTGDYVTNISGTSNQITVTGGTGESSTPTLSVPNQFTAPQDVTVTRDLQVNRNLNVNGNITIGGTSATLFTSELKIFDPDIVLGFRTDALGNDVSTDNTADHGGVAIASTEGTPLVNLFIAGIETNPATYKKIMWFKSGTFSGLGTDAWLSNYAVGIGSTQVPNGVRLASGAVQFTQNDLSAVRNINASGVTTTATLNVGTGGTVITTTSAGLVGIGTTNPTYKLDVSGSIRAASTGSFIVLPAGLSGNWTGSGFALQSESSSAPIGFLQGSSERVRIDASGNVGIGTTNPSFKLDVIGGAYVNGGNTTVGGEQNLIVKSSDPNSIPTTIATGDSNATLQVFAGGFASGSRRGGQIDFVAGAATTNPGTLIFRTGIATGGTSQPERVRIDASGNVGIGTTNPTTKLQVNSGTSAVVVSAAGSLGIGTTNPTAPLHISGADAANAKIKLEDNDNGFAASEINVANGGRDLRIAAPQDIYFEDLDTNTKTLYIKDGGNVGIGTDDPGAKLNVVDNSSSDALRITQLGSGNALVVEDSTNPDATPFVVTGIGSVGIGTTNPSEQLHLFNNQNSGTSVLVTNNNTGTAALASFRVNAGNTASISLISHGSGRTTSRLGQVLASMNEITSSTGNGILFGTQNATPLILGTNNAEAMRIDSSQNVGVGTTISIGARLHIAPTTTGIAGLFSGTTSSDMVRITQLGSGNALVVEDSANPDTTPFVVTGIGSVGIGTTNPREVLDVVGNARIGAAGAASRILFSRPADGGGGAVIGYSGLGNTDFYIQNVSGSGNLRLAGADTAGQITFQTASVERARITSGGNVGIGITNPGSLLQVVGDPAGIRITNNQGLIGDLSSSGWLISQASGTSAIPPASSLTISTGSVTALTLDGGNVGINTTDAGSTLDVQGNIRIRDTTGAATFTSGGNLAIKDNTSDPFISFHEADGTRNAFIQSTATTGFFLVQEDAFPLTIRTEQAQGIFFETSNTERMRITGVAGDVGIGTNNPGTKLHIHESNTGTTPSVRIQNSAGTIANNAVLLELFFSGDADVSGVGSAHYVRFRDNNNNPTGQISGASATTVLYATASDYRLKEDITPISNGIEQVMQFKPSEFTWKQTQTRSQGFIAHEVQEVLPEAVVGAKDAVDEEGNMIPQMIDPSKMVVVLTAALQEAIQRIQYLESVVGIGSS